MIQAIGGLIFSTLRYIKEEKGLINILKGDKKRLGADLISPISRKMTGKVNERLQATMEIQCWIGD